MLSLVESNLKLVKLFAQHGSTFPLFRGHPCVAQQSRVHLYSNAQHVEPTHAQCPAYQWELKTYRTFYKMASQELEVLQESSNEKNSKRGKTRKWTEEETEKLIDLLEKNTCSCFTTSFFWLHQWVRLLAVQPSIFVFWGDEYTQDSRPWFNMSLCEIFRMLNMLSQCWGHLNTLLNNTLTNTQHVESLFSVQIQCICTRL